MELKEEEINNADGVRKVDCKVPTVDDMKPIEYPSLELEEYEGNKARIDIAEIVEMPSKFDPSGKQWCLRVKSEVILSIPATSDEGNDMDIRASELFNVIKNGDNTIGWGKKSNLQKFLVKMKCEHPKHLIGKKATLRVYEKEIEGSPKQFLGFIKE